MENKNISITQGRCVEVKSYGENGTIDSKQFFILQPTMSINTYESILEHRHPLRVSVNNDKGGIVADIGCKNKEEQELIYKRLTDVIRTL